VATSGENYWPPTGRTSWPLTEIELTTDASSDSGNPPGRNHALGTGQAWGRTINRAHPHLNGIAYRGRFTGSSQRQVPSHPSCTLTATVPISDSCTESTALQQHWATTSSSWGGGIHTVPLPPRQITHSSEGTLLPEVTHDNGSL